MSDFIFEQQEFSIIPEQCFLIMPFKDSLRNVYDLIETIIENQCGLKCIRPDKISGSKRITDDIWKAINESRLVIADLTDRNPNVFYEVGIAHARHKPVILITQNPNAEVPFDVREIRYIQYSSDNLGELKRILPDFVKKALTTIPTKWDKDYRPPIWAGSYIKITSVEAPTIVSAGQPFEIIVKARNNGANARQGYFSVSFPSKVENVEIVEANTSTKMGKKGDSWGNGKVVLSYPIAEGFRYSEDTAAWFGGAEYFIKVRAYSSQKGLLRFYINSCSQDIASSEWKFDPIINGLDIDQRNEPVYSGVISVI